MLEVDARGLSCPMPLLKAKKGLNSVAAGEQVQVLATDSGSWRDFAVFAEQSGHKLLSAEQSSGEYCYLLEKKSD